MRASTHHHRDRNPFTTSSAATDCSSKPSPVRTPAVLPVRPAMASESGQQAWVENPKDLDAEVSTSHVEGIEDRAQTCQIE